ncbi:MAG: LptA/OstA family protein [Bacteriovoracaceae bacterium]
MMAGRFTVILFIFTSSLIGFIMLVRNLDLKREEQSHIEVKNPQEQSDFAMVHYFLVKEEKPALKLTADTLQLVNNEMMDMTSPRGEAFSEDQIPIYYQSKIGKMNKLTEVFHLTEAVKMNYKTMELTGHKASYFKKDDRFEATQNVVSSQTSEVNGDKLTIWSDQAVAWPKKQFARYTGRVHGQVDKKKAYEEGISFRSNILEADMVQNLITLREDVFFKKQDFTATSLRAEVFLENYNKKLKYYVLYDDVKLEQKVLNKDGSVLFRKGFCEKLEGQMLTETAVLTGAPKIISGTDVVTGNKITLRERAKLIEVEDNKSSLIIQKGVN